MSTMKNLGFISTLLIFLYYFIVPLSYKIAKATTWQDLAY